jgi:hypothetical protein
VHLLVRESWLAVEARAYRLSTLKRGFLSISPGKSGARGRTSRAEPEQSPLIMLEPMSHTRSRLKSMIVPDGQITCVAISTLVASVSPHQRDKISCAKNRI